MTIRSSQLFSFLIVLHLISLHLGAQVQALDCSRGAGSLPFPVQEAGTSSTQNPIEHTIVIMQENHSFDNYFGQLTQEKYYGKEVDGLTDKMSNLDSAGNIVPVYHETAVCTANPRHDWNGLHSDWDYGRNDNFVKNSGVTTMGYYNERELNYYYSLANQFAISDRFFASAMTPTYPNRFFMLTATAFGTIKNQLPVRQKGYTQKTIFELLDDYGISWRYYRNGVGYLYLFAGYYMRNRNHIAKVSEFQKDLQAGTLAQVVFIDSNWEGEDEHPGSNIQVGQNFVAGVLLDLIKSSYWANSVAFLAFDEAGGFFDHVSPPKACKPDSTEPVLLPDSIVASYDRYGFRVPFVVISPYAKHHFVSHVTHDHTSILKFIETKYNLPALTARDANADNLLDLFDFNHPKYEVSLPTPKLFTQKKKCL